MHAIAFTERLRLCHRLSFADIWVGSSSRGVEGVLSFTWRQADAANARAPLLPFLCSRMPRAMVMHWILLCSALPHSSLSSVRWVLDVQLRDVLCAHYRHAARAMVPFAPGAAALRESVAVVRDMIADVGGKFGDASFAAVVAEDLAGLVRCAPQALEATADHASAAAAALVSRNLKLLANMILPEQPVASADAESFMQMLQVIFAPKCVLAPSYVRVYVFVVHVC